MYRNLELVTYCVYKLRWPHQREDMEMVDNSVKTELDRFWIPVPTQHNKVTLSVGSIFMIH